jgi:mannose-6-phosphate isomerase-like protein (cupin superfamily)
MTLVASPPPPALPGSTRRWTAYDLDRVVRRIASEPAIWKPRVGFTADRFRTRLKAPEGVDVWLLTWLPGQGTDLHDHGDCASAFAVVQGALTEVRADEVLGVWSTTLDAPAVRLVEPGVVHDVRNDQRNPAVTIHAYAPRLGQMTFYDLSDGALHPTHVGDEPPKA